MRERHGILTVCGFGAPRERHGILTVCDFEQRCLCCDGTTLHELSILRRVLLVRPVHILGYY